ncbi:pilus assembly protein PilZ [Thalassotalea insulae]|uniref:Pilus assembly protein PilZ n=1 Tax=Thalassotalea insulae TaxID=2056778 RepID=A0ABQ6GYI6_9GAMM|nr:PilZ domain-containing protein [Thalassotalea insulae]GLX79681.1 pilus assembly protein PilZ [Thalassotalea insulae]
MIKDFSKYQSIIDEFKGQVFSSDFENRYALATKQLSKTERFLLKMELKRLAAPCTRLIDLRGHVDGECRGYEHDNRVHYLDDIAIKVFEDKLAEYQGYTFGVYEAVMNTENNFRVIYQREKTNLATPDVVPPTAKVFEKTQYPAQLFHFGPYFNRCEERMNFAIAIQVLFNEKHLAEATSSDISVNGCKFRLSAVENIKVRQLVSIRFVGLTGEFQFGKEDTFDYEVRNIQPIEGGLLVGARRVYVGAEERDGFRHFLKGFIQGNKRRYKINLDNSIKALQSRSFEQFVLPKSNELPIFLQDVGGKVTPRYALTCHNNQSIFQYWQDEARKSTIHNLITPERLQRLKKAAAKSNSLLVFSFVHSSNGKSFFYTADTQQLEQDSSFMSQFLGFAASKKSFAITLLSYLPFDAELSDSPLTLADSLAKKDEYLITPVSNDVKTTLSPLTAIVVAQSVESKDIHAFYQSLSYENINTCKLKSFGHKRLTEPLVIDDVGINFNNQRQEPRFKYKTPVVVSANGVSWTGVSHDFSTSGLKLEVEKSVVLKKGDIIDVSFPQLQKITSSFNLKGLPYEVMRLNKSKTVLNLRVYVERHQHIGRSFFKALIQKNREKLTPDEYAMLSPGLAKALRNIYSRTLKTPSLIIQTSGSRYKVEAITTNDDSAKILTYCKQLSDRKQHYNLYPLLSNLQATSLMHSTLKRMKPGNAPIKDILYIAINPHNEIIDQAVTTKLDSELKTDKLKSMFIRNALKRGVFFCLQVIVSRTDEPDMAYLNPELSYIGSYAIHRGKQLEQEIWSVAGVVQICDITEEAMFRYQMMKQATNAAV